MHAGERHAQSGILHADLKAQTLALRKIHSEDLAGSKTQGHPEGILQRHHSEDREPSREELTARCCDDRGDDHHCCSNRHKRQNHRGLISFLPENLIDEAYWYTSYQMVFQFVFTGTCSADGDKITLEAPTEATKLVYYQFDVSALYPSRFPLKMTTGENKDPVAMTASDEDMKYFNCLYIEVTDKTSAGTQTVTVDGDKIVSVS